jgi:hypothetical protein
MLLWLSEILSVTRNDIWGKRENVSSDFCPGFSVRNSQCQFLESRNHSDTHVSLLWHVLLQFWHSEPVAGFAEQRQTAFLWDGFPEQVCVGCHVTVFSGTHCGEWDAGWTVLPLSLLTRECTSNKTIFLRSFFTVLLFFYRGASKKQ